MVDNFNTYLEHIDFDTWRQLCIDNGSLQRYAKGEEFVSVGKVGRNIGFIKSGTLKYVARGTDGTEHVMGLIFSGTFVADWPFCIYNQPAKLAIVATTDCEIYCLPSLTVTKMMVSDPHFRDIVMHSTEAIYTTVYDRYVDLYCKTPQQRYEEMIALHSDVFNLFSLKDIASFLNISPTHLSRLRKK